MASKTISEIYLIHLDNEFHAFRFYGVVGFQTIGTIGGLEFGVSSVLLETRDDDGGSQPLSLSVCYHR